MNESGKPAWSVATGASHCRAALASLVQGNLEGWHGLRADCDQASLEAAIGSGGQLMQGRLSGFPARFLAYPPATRGSIQAWLDDSDHLFLVTIDRPTIVGDPTALLGALGPPEAKLDPGVGIDPIAHQWIYAARGLTLYVDEAHNTITRVAGYRPAATSFYEHRLGATDRPHRWPRGPSGS